MNDTQSKVRVLTEVDQSINFLWRALKEQCCVNPQSAVRIVLLERGAFESAMKKVLERASNQE